MSLRDRIRDAHENSARQWANAHGDIRNRTQRIVALLPEVLRSPLPNHMTSGLRHLILGIMLHYVDDRHYRVQRSGLEPLPWDAEMESLLHRVEAGFESPQAIRDLVARIRADVAAALEKDRADIPVRAAEIASYVHDHMGLRFQSHGRKKLIALISVHLEMLMANPMPQTLEAEKNLCALELECADEFEARTREAVA